MTTPNHNLSTPPIQQEFRVLPTNVMDEVSGLPKIPGGWTTRSWQVEGREFQLHLPASPDAFLDHPDVIAAHERDEYMPYWAFLWPASLLMAARILHAPWQPGSRVLELGTGVGMVGLAALARGDIVTMTDYDAQSVTLALHNAMLADFRQARGMTIDWRTPPREIYPVIIGCELLYEDRNHDMLLHLLDQMLEPGGCVWFGDGGRVRAARFCELAREQGYRVSLFDEAGESISTLRVGKFQLIQLDQRRSPAN